MEVPFPPFIKTTGSRFVFVKDKLAMMERALSNFMLDIHTSNNGYEEISPPLLASENTMFGTGQLPKFEEDLYKIPRMNLSSDIVTILLGNFLPPNNNITIRSIIIQRTASSSCVSFTSS